MSITATVKRHDENVIIVPRQQPLQTVIDTLSRVLEDETSTVNLRYEVPGIPIDVAYVLGKVAEREYGWQFGDTRGQNLIDVTDSGGRSVKVLTSGFEVPGIAGKWTLSPAGNSLIIKVSCPKSSEIAVSSLVAVLRRELPTLSLYKGKALKVPENAETLAQFISVSDATCPILPRATERLLAALVWQPITARAMCHEAGLNTRRGVLLAGDYGTGKTLTAMYTARLCSENRTTFFHLGDANSLIQTYALASLYGPSVLFVEDIDTLEEDTLKQLDDLQSKTADVLLIMTTNHADKLPASFLRPGRLDAVIVFPAPDADTASRLVNHYLGEDVLTSRESRQIGELLQGHIPAVIAEVVSRARLLTLGSPEAVSYDDLRDAAATMDAHLELARRAKATVNDTPALDTAFQEAIKRAIQPVSKRVNDTFEVADRAEDRVIEMQREVSGVSDLPDIVRDEAAGLRDAIEALDK